MLDHLARALDLVGEDQVTLRPSPSTVAVVHWLPTCDRCRHSVLARYDALLEEGYGTNLCTDCFRKIGHKRLGPGKAQYLLTTAEVTDPVRAVVGELTNRYGLDSYWANEPGDPHWVRAYRACGFGGPDEYGRMSRELYGRSVWIREGTNRVVHVDEVSYERELNFGQVNDYRVPVEWDADQVRHFLVKLVMHDGPWRIPYSRLDESLARAAERTVANLDAGHFPSSIIDDAVLDPPRPLLLSAGASVPHADAERCARESDDAWLIGRLVRECPLSDVQMAALLNPVCPGEVLLDCCTGAVPGLQHWVLQRSDLTPEMLQVLAQAAVTGPSSHQGDRAFITRVLLHPGCPEDSLASLVDRIKAAPTRERIALASDSRTLPLKRRQTIATHLLRDARRSKVASAVIDALIGVEGAAHGTLLPDEEMLSWLVGNSHRTIKRLSQDRVRDLGLQSAFLI